MNVNDFTSLRHPFLTGICAEHLKVLAGSAMPTHFAAGTVIFREGDIANRFYLVNRGKVALETRLIGGNSVAIQSIGPGDVVGWSWLFSPYLWHFDARAVEDTDATFFYGTRLREQCEADKTLGYELMKRIANVVVNRLQATRVKLIAEQSRDPHAEVPVGEQFHEDSR